MKVIGLDGQQHNWNLSGRKPTGEQSRPRSSFHLRARKLLEKLFPFDQRLEELPLPGSNKLSADFFIPNHGLIVEVHGQQHYAFSTHMHGTELGFNKSKLRDQKKVRWCQQNGFQLVELPHNENDDEWRKRILAATSPDGDEAEAEG